MSATGKKSSDASCSASQDAGVHEWPPELQRLKRNDPNLTSFRIHVSHQYKCKEKKGRYHPRKEGDWKLLGEAIAANTNLRRLDLLSSVRNYASSEESHEKFYAILNKNRTIRRLELHRIETSGEILTSHLSLFLENNTTLTSLSATDCRLELEGTRSLCAALARKTSSLKYLDLSNARITDEACRELAAVLGSSHRRLRSLELNGNSIQNSGCVAISNNLLKNPNSMLVRLYLDRNCIHDEGAEALADGLVGNERLKTMSINENRAIWSRGYEAFSKALCNFPGTDDILDSNHTLERLGADHRKLSAELKSSLRFNRATNKRHAANRKVVMHHFVYNTNLDLFGTVPGDLIPRVLAMIADHAVRSEAGKNNRTGVDARNHYKFVKNDYKIRHLALHRIIRLFPSVCERVAGRGDGQSSNSGGSGDNLGCGASKRRRLSHTPMES